MKKLLFTVILIGVTAAFLFICLFVVKYIDTPYAGGKPIIIQIKKGETLPKIAQTLAENNLVAEKSYFLWYAKINKLYPQIKAGEYFADAPLSLRQLGELLTSGQIYYRKITIPEGLTAREITAVISENTFLNGQTETISEGEILPETYTFSRGDSRNGIIAQGRKSMQNILDSAWNERDADLPLQSKEEMLVLASIVEKETGIAAERPQIASVFINRLRKGMLLQTDPTVIYAVTEGKADLNRPLYRKDLEIDSPYNTYKYAGLPPKPICSPGKEAITAVAHPDKTPYLYFVASGNGGHNFAVTLAEHNENVRKWRSQHK
jgi:UPF0755 protein